MNTITQVENNTLQKYTHTLVSPTGLTVLALLGAYILMGVFLGDSRKKKIATSYWGGKKESNTAKKKALSQLASPKCDSACLYIGDPQTLKETKTTGLSFCSLFPKKTGIYIPDVQRGTAAIGAPGSGKTYSAINPLVFSAIEQGFPIILYDFKYPSQAKIAAYAKSHGYDVHIFAPGFAESEVCNPLDFLTDSSDAETARQIATVINKNFRILNNSSEDGFFGPSGDQLTQAILMLTKEFGEYADVMTAAAILSSENMVERLMAASLNPWVKIAFGQLFSSAKSEKTVAGIVATASIMFSRFMAKNTLGCFIGKTTLPMKLKSKQMIIFGLDRSHRDASAPLMTSIFHITASFNIQTKRSEPLIVVIDELPSFYLPDLFKWLNESRSEGFCGILGWQNMGQLEKIYGKEVAKAILGACGTKFIFNPGENESAQLFSSFLGDEEVRYKHKSRSSGGGKPSTTISEQEKVKKLLESSQFLKLPTGKCVFINPAYANTLEGSVPLFKKIHIPRYLKMIDKYNEQNWHKVVKMLTQTSTQRRPSPEDLSLRVAEINRRFPLINKDEANSNKQDNNSVLTINEVKSILDGHSDVVVI